MYFVSVSTTVTTGKGSLAPGLIIVIKLIISVVFIRAGALLDVGGMTTHHQLGHGAQGMSCERVNFVPSLFICGYLIPSTHFSPSMSILTLALPVYRSGSASRSRSRSRSRSPSRSPVSKHKNRSRSPSHSPPRKGRRRSYSRSYSRSRSRSNSRSRHRRRYSRSRSRSFSPYRRRGGGGGRFGRGRRRGSRSPMSSRKRHQGNRVRGKERMGGGGVFCMSFVYEQALDGMPLDSGIYLVKINFHGCTKL